ncbi:MAG TPA: type IV pilus secretin PilQ [Thermoanaerobaculia bacterium]|jgi:type IV pilus assembly protein PilQ
MRRAKRIVLVAILLVGSVGAADAGLFKRKADKPAEAAAAPMSLTAIELDGSRVLLQTSGAPAYTSYSPSPNVFVVDLTGTGRPATLSIPTTLPSSVASLTADEVVEMGSRLTRVTFRLTQSFSPQASAIDGAVVVTLPASAPMQTAATPALEPVAAPQSTLVETLPAEVPAPVAEPVVENLTPAPAPAPARAEISIEVPAEPLKKAKNVRRVETASVDGDVEVRISGDGSMTYKAFRLENPARLVVDLNGVKNGVAKNAVEVDDDVVKRVRVAQFQTAPVPVTRVVIDLTGKSEYTIRNVGDSVRVAFGAAQFGTAAPRTAAATPKPVQQPVQQAMQQPAPQLDAPKPAASKKINIIDETAAAAPKFTPRAAEPQQTDVAAQVPVVAENAVNWQMPAAPAAVTNTNRATTAPAPRGARAVINAPIDQAPPDTRRNEDVFQDAQQAQPLVGTMANQAGRQLSSGQRQFTGEPISLALKDADIKDVLRTFAQLTGLNIAVDPGVTGQVTVDFVEVPWDQALDLILRQNGLTYVLEGNVMRVGRIDRIRQEAREMTDLQEQERLNVPLTTLSFKLSYARAQEVASVLTSMASPRARIIVDSRTNQLIISEIPQYLQTMRNLIETLDVPTRQVVIEARIVETSKLFQQQYGFNWGFDGLLDPTVGTGTGLVFPNRVSFTGGPFEFGPGDPVISFSLSDVLGTFNLDFALNAFEQEGLVKVISAPRVTTQDNTPAEIQSGFQIPYQTRINFTTTVTYLDATLRLSVTPQITESGTVIMDIALQKNEPATGLAIEGAAGTPLTTRQARTRLMVRDGGTAVIAGIYQATDNNSQIRLPFIHQIPIIGNLFKTHNVQTRHDELLIFITPRIVRG